MSTRSYMPFAELLVGDHFTIHPKHLGSRKTSPVFVKTSRDAFKNTNPSDNHPYSMCPRHRFKPMVALCDSQPI